MPMVSKVAQKALQNPALLKLAWAFFNRAGSGVVFVPLSGLVAAHLQCLRLFSALFSLISFVGLSVNLNSRIMEWRYIECQTNAYHVMWCFSISSCVCICIFSWSGALPFMCSEEDNTKAHFCYSMGALNALPLGDGADDPMI